MNSISQNYNLNYGQWFREIKAELLLSEPQNIAARAQCCQKLINESIAQLNLALGLTQLSQNQLYKCEIDARAHLKFLTAWPGLRIGSNRSKAPRSKREYEKKAKNWLNGRRAPNYGKTLFPQFISEAEQYSNKVTKYLLATDSQQQSLYYKILIYKILAALCGCSVSLNEQAKKAPFFCKNSIERKGKLKQILQAYAYDHQYIQGFPSCFEEAIDYFENKSNQYFSQYRQAYLSVNTELAPNSNLIKAEMENHESNDSDGDTVIESDTKLNPKMKSSQSIKNELLFWQTKAAQLQSELEFERNKRIKIEKERDNLQQLFNLLQQRQSQSQSMAQLTQPMPYQMFATMPQNMSSNSSVTIQNNYGNINSINSAPPQLSAHTLSNLQTLHNLQAMNQRLQTQNQRNSNNQIGEQMAQNLLRILQSDI